MRDGRNESACFSPSRGRGLSFAPAGRPPAMFPTGGFLCRIWRPKLAARLALVVVLSAAGLAAQAGEPAQQFLEALRARGYFDTALEYLDAMATSRLAPPEFRTVLPYERAITLLAAAQVERDAAVRERRLDEAETSLRQFVEQQSEHAQRVTAQRQLGALIAERARLKQERANRGAQQLGGNEARRLYEAAYQVFRELQENLAGLLNALPDEASVSGRAQAELIQRRDELRGEYVQTQLLAAAIREEMADTYPAGSDESNALLDEVAKQYLEIHQKYARRLAGQYALLYRGRVLKKRGQLKESLECFVHLLDSAQGGAEVRALKTETLPLAMECWLDPGLNNYGEAIKRGAAWVASARGAEERTPEWLRLRLLLAKAYLAQAEALAASGTTSKDARGAEQARGEARQLALFVSKHTSPFQAEAQEILVRLGRPALTKPPTPPSTFAEAKDAGREAVDALQTAALLSARVAESLAQEPDAQAKAALQGQLAEAEQTMQMARDEAESRLGLALRLAEASTDLEELNLVRYYLAYVYYTGSRHHESAVLGDFVARRYPASTSARDAAKIAFASYLRLFAESPETQREFATQRLISCAETLVQRWPDQPEAKDALERLVPLLAATGRFADAARFLALVPAGSPQRVAAEMLLGHALWSTYLREKSTPQPAQSGDNAAGDKPDAERLAQLRTQAEETLVRGLQGLPSAAGDSTAAVGALSLAQLYVETQRPEQAIGVLEHPQYGPLTLVAQKHESAQQAGFTEEAYKTALRAYIGALASADQPDQLIRKARGVMDGMENRLKDTPEGQQRLIAIYVGLAKDLETQLQQAEPQVKRALAKGFETFLTQLSEGAGELNILHWVAETFLTLGSSVANGRAPDTEALAYYERSAATFQKILERFALDDALKTQIRLRRAAALRGLQAFEQAIAALEEILKEKPLLVSVQVEAARTYQQWAATPGNAARYEQAMMGGPLDPETKRSTVWGWAKVAQTTASYPQFRDTFQDARYNLAVCRYNLALSQQGAAREQGLRAAETDIGLTFRLYGLGDEQRTRQYDALLKLVQQNLGKPVDGLRALTNDAAKKTGNSKPAKRP